MELCRSILALLIFATFFRLSRLLFMNMWIQVGAQHYTLVVSHRNLLTTISAELFHYVLNLCSDVKSWVCILSKPCGRVRDGGQGSESGVEEEDTEVLPLLLLQLLLWLWALSPYPLPTGSCSLKQEQQHGAQVLAATERAMLWGCFCSRA